MPASGVSLSDLLHRVDFERLVGDDALEPQVCLLELLQTLRTLGLNVVVPVMATVNDLLRNLEFLRCFSGHGARTRKALCLMELADESVTGVPSGDPSILSHSRTSDCH